MTDSKASPIVRFANAMPPSCCFSAASSGMALALEGLDSAIAARTTDRETVIRAVLAGIQQTDRFSPIRDPAIREALTSAVEIFVDEVWPVVFKSRQPSELDRGWAITDYIHAFDHRPQTCQRGEAVFLS